MLPMLPSLGRAREESEAVTDSVPVLSQKGTGKLQNHLQNDASRTQYLEASNMEPAGTCSSMNTVKKDGGLRPCQDYQYLNEHTVKNTNLLPLISTLIDKLKGAKYCSKMDI